jgi:glycosyltransferase involved in cell wall biosynthesis
MSAPLITCVVPVYNGERFLAETIESILAQTHQPIEVIVVDDGSTDGTPEVTASFGNAVRCVRQANAGLAAARNTGIEHARGEFVAFLDADDLWHPEKLARQMTRFQARPDLDLCITAFQNFWMPEAEADERRFRNHRIARPFAGYVVPALLARRSAFDRYGLFDPALRYSPGAPWFVRAIGMGATLEVIPDVLMRRRLHSGNLSRTAVRGSLDGFMHFIKGKLDLDRRRTPSSAKTDPEP